MQPHSKLVTDLERKRAISLLPKPLPGLGIYSPSSGPRTEGSLLGWVGPFVTPTRRSEASRRSCSAEGERAFCGDYFYPAPIAWAPLVFPRVVFISQLDMRAVSLDDWNTLTCQNLSVGPSLLDSFHGQPTWSAPFPATPPPTLMPISSSPEVS